MNEDIRKALEFLDLHIDGLLDIRNKLAAEFAEPARARRASGPRPARNGAGGNGVSRKEKTEGPTRKDELKAFFATHGPRKRAEISAESKIPVGTVANLLTKDEFMQHPDGRWDVRKEAVQ